MSRLPPSGTPAVKLPAILFSHFHVCCLLMFNRINSVCVCVYMCAPIMLHLWILCLVIRSFVAVWWSPVMSLSSRPPLVVDAELLYRSGDLLKILGHFLRTIGIAVQTSHYVLHMMSTHTGGDGGCALTIQSACAQQILSSRWTYITGEMADRLFYSL